MSLREIGPIRGIGSAILFRQDDLTPQSQIPQDPEEECGDCVEGPIPDDDNLGGTDTTIKPELPHPPGPSKIDPSVYDSDDFTANQGAIK